MSATIALSLTSTTRKKQLLSGGLGIDGKSTGDNMKKVLELERELGLISDCALSIAD